MHSLLGCSEKEVIDTMKKEYNRPELIEFGTVEQLTLGSSGSQFDLNFLGGLLVPDSSNPGCTTNGPPACVNFPTTS